MLANLHIWSRESQSKFLASVRVRLHRVWLKRFTVRAHFMKKLLKSYICKLLQLQLKKQVLELLILRLTLMFLLWARTKALKWKWKLQFILRLSSVTIKALKLQCFQAKQQMKILTKKSKICVTVIHALFLLKTGLLKWVIQQKLILKVLLTVLHLKAARAKIILLNSVQVHLFLALKIRLQATRLKKNLMLM